MAVADQADFWNVLEARAKPALDVILSAERRRLVSSHEVDLEGSPNEAAKIIGLPVKEIYKLIESGDLRARRPKANLPSYKDRRDSRGRRLPLGIRVDLKHAFELLIGIRFFKEFLSVRRS